MQTVISKRASWKNGNLSPPEFFALVQNVNGYLFLYPVDGEYDFLDLISFLVNHFRLLNHAAPYSLMAVQVAQAYAMSHSLLYIL